MDKKAFVDRDLCISCSVCTTECPEVFVLKQDPLHEDDFKSFTNDFVDQKPLIQQVDNAIHNCPAKCISWK